MMLSASSMEARAAIENEHALKVMASDNRVLVFDEQAPIQGLITFQNIVLGQLLYAADSYTIEPGMLKIARWDFKENCYILELDDSITFHNGRKATAEDLEFSITRGLFTKKYSWVRAFLSNIRGIDAIVPGTSYRSKAVSGIKIAGDRTIRVYLAQPNPAFLLSLGRATFALVPKEELQSDLYTWRSHPIGAGPYKVKLVDTTTAAVTVEKIKSSTRGPNLIEFSSEGGGINDDLILVGADGSSKLKKEILSKATSVTGIFFNFDHPLVHEFNFRAAIALLVNRKELTQGVPEYVANSEVLATHQYGRAGIVEHESLEGAKNLLKGISAKLPKGVLRVPVFNSGFGKDKYGSYLAVLSDQFKAAGLKIEFFNSSKKFFDNTDGEFPIRIVSPGADPADPLVIFNLFKNGGPFAKHAPKNDQVYERLIREAANAESLDVKAQTIKTLSEYVYKQRYFVPLFERRPVVFYNSKKITSLGEQNGGLTFLFDRLELADAKGK